MKIKLPIWILAWGAIGLSLSCLGNDISDRTTDVPVVSNVQMVQNLGNRQVTITYDTTESLGIITLDIQTNGVSIGAENFRNVSGDVNQEVEPGSHMITWQPERSWPGHKVTNATAKICAWAKSSPPDYMAVWLQLPPPNNVKWYVCEAALPEGIESDTYRGKVLLLRHIKQPEGGDWIMGSPSTELGRATGIDENYHRVTLTNDYWIGVFEVTQAQWELVNKLKPGMSPAAHKGDFRPVEQVSYEDIRGDEQCSYPNAPSANSFLGKLRSITGLSFDLPSDMQWEYACRAGVGTAWNNGTDITQAYSIDTELNKLGRYRDNGGKLEDPQKGWEVYLATARVGSYQSNAWGIYDMHGNVYEWCLDWYTPDISQLNGAVNYKSGTQRINRGGCWAFTAANCRSARRFSEKPTQPKDSIGFRIVCLGELPSLK